MDKKILIEIEKLVNENSLIVAQNIIDRYNDLNESTIIEFANYTAIKSFMDFPEYDKDDPITGVPDALTILFSEYAEDFDSSDLYDYFENRGNIFL
ncbi:hypothetical protein [uncultured Flavobacterium sp.]|uniref:hypothetical protein n=1 Tax=uncultured Flavobacterium sp. TaxID=165435 RepID=UPI002596F1EA|nr:hypothetical protein [uncultured Flavobacterium sp.]